MGKILATMKNVFKWEYIACKNLFAFCNCYLSFVTLFYTMSATNQATF